MTNKFLNFIDMIDGGGAGQMGDKFAGGGLLSFLANAIATPYGAANGDRKQRAMQPHGLSGPSQESASMPAATRPEQVRPQMRQPAAGMTFGNTPVGGGMPAAPAPAPAPSQRSDPSLARISPQSMVGPSLPSGMPNVHSPEFDRFMEIARALPEFGSVVNNPEAMANIFKAYQQQVASGGLY
jgi:hypothetical protein